MPNASDIAWFKENFAKPITAAVAGTPFDLDMLTAIACQETGYIWQVLRRKNLPLDRTLRALRRRYARRQPWPLGLPEDEGGFARQAQRGGDVRHRTTSPRRRRPLHSGFQ